MANGKAILEKEDATKAERDDATKAINDAIAGLTSNGRVELDAALKKARSIGPKFYTEDSFAILTAAIENGQAVYDNPESSKQQCDDATAAIEAAINGLVSNGKRDPFNRIEAEKFDDSYGSVKSESNYGASNGQSVGYVAVGDYLVYNKIDFEDSNGASKITINYANMYDSEVEIRLGSTDGALVATLKLPATGSWTRFEETTIDLDTAIDPEVVDLYMVFTKQSTNVDYFSFTESEEAPLPSEEDLQALKDAIAEAEAYDADNYTEDSYAALTSAVEDGKALLDNAEATKTQVLDATQAIKDAIDALTAKEFVLSASADKDTYEPNETITLTIKTSADRSRFALLNENGKYVTILGMKSVYNPEDNTKTWTIKTAVASQGEDRVLTIATAAVGGSFVNSSVTVSFSVAAKPSGEKILSVSSAGMAKVNESFVVEVETTANVETVGIFNERGNAITKEAVESTVNGDVKTFKITISVGSVGNRIFTAKIKDPATGRYIDDPCLTFPITITK